MAVVKPAAAESEMWWPP